MTLLAEFYESDTAPHEALGRAARRLSNGGALYLGGGVGIEKVKRGDAESFSITRGDGKNGESFAGPLSAVIRGMGLAGSSTAADSPGGTSSVGDPAVAARLRELADREREIGQDIDRYTRRLANRPKAGLFPMAPGVEVDDRWEQRRINELRVELTQVRAERASLLSSGRVAEAEVGKPGTNWKQVSPEAKKKVAPLVRHWMSKAHPWQACVDELAPEKGMDAAKRICSVVKDLGMKSTKWRKGGQKVTEEVERMLDEAAGRLAVVEEEFGFVALVQLAEGVDGAPEMVLALAEAVTADLGLLALAGNPLAETVLGVEEAFDTTKHPHVPGGPHGGQFAKVLGGRPKLAARLAPARRGVPQGSGAPASVAARSSRGVVHRSSVNKTRTTVEGKPRAPGAGAERAAAAKPRRKLTEKELPGAVGTGAWSKAAKAAVDGLHKGTIVDTEQHHRLPGSGGKMGPYRPERIELHARIARALLQGSGAHSNPQAHFMAGGPASGKSRLLKDGQVNVPADAVDVNPDIVKTMLPEYQALVARGDKLASSKVHEESSHIAKTLMNLALARGHHVVVDGTGNSGPGKFAAKVQAAHAAGHRVDVHYATVPTDVAIKRAAARGEKTGRHVPEGYIRSAHRDVSRAFLDSISKLKDARVRVFDTNAKRTRTVFEKDRGSARGKVTHKGGYADFAGKAGEGA